MRKTRLVSKSGPLNTLTLAGISVLWGVMLGLINPWWSVLATLCLLSGFGTEIRKTYD